jgi:hypothetical protein
MMKFGVNLLVDFFPPLFLDVRPLGRRNGFVNNQHCERLPVFRRFWASARAATTSLRADSYAHSATGGRLNRFCCDHSIGWRAGDPFGRGAPGSARRE